MHWHSTSTVFYQGYPILAFKVGNISEFCSAFLNQWMPRKQQFASGTQISSHYLQRQRPPFKRPSVRSRPRLGTIEFPTFSIRNRQLITRHRTLPQARVLLRGIAIVP